MGSNSISSLGAIKWLLSRYHMTLDTSHWDKASSGASRQLYLCSWKPWNGKSAARIATKSAIMGFILLPLEIILWLMTILNSLCSEPYIQEFMDAECCARLAYPDTYSEFSDLCNGLCRLLNFDSCYELSFKWEEVSDSSNFLVSAGKALYSDSGMFICYASAFRRLVHRNIRSLYARTALTEVVLKSSHDLVHVEFSKGDLC